MRKPKKKITIWSWAPLLGVLTALIVVLCFWSSPSFSLSKICPSQGFFFQPAKVASQNELANLREMMNQPFNFLDEGKEFYVFVSQDQKHVLKFFKMRRLTPKYWLNYVPLPWLDKKRLSKVDERERMRMEVFNGLKTAFERFRYQTGLTFLHLFRTDYLKTKVIVTDSQGKAHKISLDSVPFVVQKKAVMLPEYIGALVKDGKEDEAIRSLCQILDLVKEGCLCGFADDSERIEADYGFIEGRPLHIGGGLVVQDESLKNYRNILREVFRVSKAIEAWLAPNYPELAMSFQDEVQDLLSYLEQG